MNCIACEEPLEKFWLDNTVPHRRKTDQSEFKNELEVSFGGGYNSYFDGYEYGTICNKCADILLEKNPWIAKLIKGYY